MNAVRHSRNPYSAESLEFKGRAGGGKQATTRLWKTHRVGLALRYLLGDKPVATVSPAGGKEAGLHLMAKSSFKLKILYGEAMRRSWRRKPIRSESRHQVTTVAVAKRPSNKALKTDCFDLRASRALRITRKRPAPPALYGEEVTRGHASVVMPLRWRRHPSVDDGHGHRRSIECHPGRRLPQMMGAGKNSSPRGSFAK